MDLFRQISKTLSIALKQFLGKVEIDEDQNEFGIPDASKGITYAVMTLWIHNFWNGSKFVETTNVTVS